MPNKPTYDELEQRVRQLEAKDSLDERSAIGEFIESLPCGVTVHNRNGQIIASNLAAQAILEFTNEQLFGKKLNELPWTLLREDGGPLPAEQYPLVRVIAENESVSEVLLGIQRNDRAEPSWVVCTAKPEFDRNGTITRVFSSFTDITAVKKSEERYKLFSNPSFGGSVVHDKGRILDCSSGFSNTTGYSYSELIGMDGLLLIAPAWRNFVEEKIKSGSEEPYEVESVRKDGTLFPARIHATTVQYQGKPIRVGEFRDITELWQKEAALRESERLLRNVINSSTDFIFVKDKQLKTVICNEQFAFAVGKKPSDLVGRTDIENGWDAELVKGNSGKGIPGYEKGDLEALSGKTVQTTDTAVISGETRFLDTVKIPLKDENNEILGVVGRSRDITMQERAKQALKKSEEQFRSLVDQTPYPIVVVDKSGEKILHWSSSARELFGHSPKTSAEWYSLAYPDPQYRKEVIQRSNPHIEQARRSKTPVNAGEYHITCRDGSVKICEIYAQSISDYLVLTNNDITERKRAEYEQRLAASVFAYAPNGVVIADSAMRILDINPRYVKMTGFSKSGLLGQPLTQLVMTDDISTLLEAPIAGTNAANSNQIETRVLLENGSSIPVMLSLVKVYNDEGEIQNYLMVFNDISTLKAQQAELERLSNHDSLTGLPNRRLLLDRLQQAMGLADRSEGEVAVCYFDLDGFKPINDEHGHEAGDQCLIKIGELLQANVRRHDSVARIGGDEFVLVLNGLKCPMDDCRTQLDRVLAAIRQPVVFDGVPHRISASIGVTLYPSDHSDADTLLNHADQAMYRAKQSGGSCYQFYTVSAPEEAREERDNGVL